MSSMGKGQLNLDVTSLAESDNVGAYVRASDGTLVTHTTVSGKEGLDVNLINASIAVTSTNLDIRDLVFATDKVDVSGSTVKMQDGSGNAITSTGGALDVNVTSGTISFSPNYAYLDGAAHAPLTDDGAYVLAIDPSGNYAGMHVDASGNLKVTSTSTVPSTILAQAVAVGTTEVALPATPLANRKSIQIQNLGNKNLFIGLTGVTAADGLKIPPNAEIELEYGPGVALFAISTASAQDVRIVEAA